MSLWQILSKYILFGPNPTLDLDMMYTTENETWILIFPSERESFITAKLAQGVCECVQCSTVCEKMVDEVEEKKRPICSR